MISPTSYQENVIHSTERNNLISILFFFTFQIYGKCLTVRNLLGEIIKKLNYDQLIDLSFEDSIISLKFIEQETNCDQFSLLQIRCDKVRK